VAAGILEASFSIGPDIIIERPDVVLINGPGALGVDFLKDYVISIDMANRLVRIRASTSTP
jgi:hypothetical protein